MSQRTRTGKRDISQEVRWMSTPIVRAMLLVELVAPKMQDLHLGLMDALDTEAQPPSPTPSSPSRTLDLSASRAHDRALDILGV
jgi:hypothetical protein